MRAAVVEKSADTQAAAAHTDAPRQGIPWWSRHAVLTAVLLVGLATARIVATYSELSSTIDEAPHLSTGIEWLDEGTYTLEPLHPPLTRVFLAFLPWMDGAHGGYSDNLWLDGFSILYSGDRDAERTLTLARLGILPLFWAECFAIFVVTGWIGGRKAAVLAVALATLTPSLLAHAGVATTDTGLTATFLLAYYALWRYIEDPGRRRALWLGIAGGLAVLSKFSFLVFLPSAAAVAAGAALFTARPTSLLAFCRERLPGLALAAGLAAMVIWAGYRFSSGTSPGLGKLTGGALQSLPVPAPELFDGIEQLRQQNAAGRISYFMGEMGTGWYLFYVVGLGVKTPLAILALALPGLWLLARGQYGLRGWLVVSLVVGIVGCASFVSRIQIGTRHILPVFACLAIAGALILERLLAKGGAWAAAAGALMLWLGVSTIAAHPDQLGYFNEIAGGKGEKFLVDSDLEWGQSFKHLGRRLNELGVKQVVFAPNGDPQKMYPGFPEVLPEDRESLQAAEWYAVSLTYLKHGFIGGKLYRYEPGTVFWPEKDPTAERIGGYLLIHRKPKAQQARAAGSQPSVPVQQ